MDLEGDIKRATQLGQENKKVWELLQNWCRHISLENWGIGGIGLVEQMTGLPIGHKYLKCPYAKQPGMATAVLDHAALDFYDRNCNGCQEREPVGMPNIISLVEKREEARRDREAEAKEREQKHARALEARQAKRATLQLRMDNAEKQLLECIEIFDRSPTERNAKLLVEAFKVGRPSSSSPLVTALVDLAASLEPYRTTAALEALESLEPDEPRLLDVCVGAVARIIEPERAVRLMTRSMGTARGEQIRPAIPTLVHMAAPIRYAGLGRPKRVEAPLILVYNAFPDEVMSVLRSMLATSEKTARMSAAGALAVLIRHAPEKAEEMANALLWAADQNLPDDEYDPGSAQGEIANALATAMRVATKRLGEVLSENIESPSENRRTTAAKALMSVVHGRDDTGARDTEERPPNEAERVAVDLLVKVLAKHKRGILPLELTSSLTYAFRQFPSLLEEHATVLLGTAILLATELAAPAPAGTILVPGIAGTAEKMTTHMHLRRALNDVASLIGMAAENSPDGFGPELLKIWDSVREDSSLRASLVAAIGRMAKSAAGLPRALPALYSAMTDRAPLVRAAAVVAYGELLRANRELPPLMHECMLAHLVDPFTVVHSSAARILKYEDVPERIRQGVADRLTLLVRVYATSHQDDETLADCLLALLRILHQMKILTTKHMEAVCGILKTMKAPEATEVALSWSGVLGSSPQFANVVVGLLESKKTYDFKLDELFEVVRDLPVGSIKRIAKDLVQATRSCGKRGYDFSEELIELLSLAEEWSLALQVAEEMVAEIPSTDWERRHKLRAQSIAAAVQVEHGVATDSAERVQQGIRSRRRAVEELRRWDEAKE